MKLARQTGFGEKTLRRSSCVTNVPTTDGSGHPPELYWLLTRQNDGLANVPI
jgi:hypothetical protein